MFSSIILTRCFRFACIDGSAIEGKNAAEYFFDEVSSIYRDNFLAVVF